MGNDGHREEIERVFRDIEAAPTPDGERPLTDVIVRERLAVLALWVELEMSNVDALAAAREEYSRYVFDEGSPWVGVQDDLVMMLGAILEGRGRGVGGRPHPTR